MDILAIIACALCVISGIICLTAGLMKKGPNDITLISVFVVELVVIIYALVYLVATLTGHSPRGPAWEFWGYVLTALVIPIGVVYWAFVDRKPMSNIIMSAAGFIVAIMIYRMEQIWHLM